jgi:hypothetical protein
MSQDPVTRQDKPQDNQTSEFFLGKNPRWGGSRSLRPSRRSRGGWAARCPITDRRDTGKGACAAGWYAPASQASEGGAAPGQVPQDGRRVDGPRAHARCGCRRLRRRSCLGHACACPRPAPKFVAFLQVAELLDVPYGIRTRVTNVKGRWSIPLQAPLRTALSRLAAPARARCWPMRPGAVLPAAAAAKCKAGRYSGRDGAPP